MTAAALRLEINQVCGFLQNLRMAFKNTKDAPLSEAEKELAKRTYRELDKILKLLDEMHMNQVNISTDDEIIKDMAPIYDKRLLPYVARCLEIVEESDIRNQAYTEPTAVMGMHIG